MVRNATLLYYPIKESILSILPIVDEFVIAVGKGEPGDRTLEEIEGIGSDKIRIIHTEWDLSKYPNGTENAHQTDIARASCSGDWLFYLQADEVVHEKDLPTIESRCRQLLNDREVEGLLFNYYHFWGDYDHYHTAHGWYPHEIRIVRNDPEIHSWESAQSFRRIPGFDYKNYRQQQGTHKLNVAAVDAHIYHYGYVRPPDFMQRKRKALDTIHRGEERVAADYQKERDHFDYGALGQIAAFKGTHPAVMHDRMDAMDWKDQLNYSKSADIGHRKPFKHETFKNKVITAVEQHLNGGKQLFTFKNYNLLKR